jgi:hypothetical protein
LFSNHAFPYNNGNPPTNIDEQTTRVVCANCGGIPLAIKAIGRSMVHTTHPQEWEVAAQKLSIADSLKLSYDALRNYIVNLQLSFLCATVVFRKDQIVHVESQVIPLWIREGLLAGYNPFEMGRIYMDLLADHCLIEPTMRDIHGSVLCFRIHDIVCNLGIQFAEEEESFFYCHVGKDLTTLLENACAGRTQILLKNNKLSSLPESLRGPEICSWLMNPNKHFTKMPKRVIGSMISLRVLD